MIKFIYSISPFLDLAAPLVALLFFFFRREKKLEEHIYILLFIVAQLVFNTTAKIFMYLEWYNAIIYQANYAVSLVILTIYFLVKYNKIINTKAYNVLLSISVLSVIITLIITDPRILILYNSRSAAFVSVIVSLHAVIYYYLKLLNPEVEKITRTRSFWFVTGLFTYYSGSFFIVATYRSFIQERQDNFFSLLWSMHNVIFFLMCVSFSIGFVCKRYQTT